MTAGVVQTGSGEGPADASAVEGEYTRMRWPQLIWSSTKARAGIILLLLFVLVALLAPVIAPYEGTRSDFGALLPPSGDHLLGTTSQGGDIFSQLIYGSRISLTVGLFGGLVSTAIALIIGMWSGYKEGTVTDDILSFITNVAIVVPVLPLMIVLIAYSEVRGVPLMVFVIGITSWAGHARAKRSQIITLRNRDFVTAAKFAGEGRIFREIMPSMTSLVAAGFVGAATGAIGAEAGLSFLGLGDPNTVSWGTMLYQADAQGAVAQGLWLWVLAPGLVLALLITSLTFINFGVDLLSNPHLRED
ncbi:ABC transporter permease [Actinomadura alba]|uniref:ABC transporter permease n=1 Tax=Actinomadura alba TaxID=406431 RepID=A0ABR7LWD8_9ACTN|nr:ABC transporter permease [Actinomadura alba]MBC6468790.1 ABC transporter permease [Actinomadura alba]